MFFDGIYYNDEKMMDAARTETNGMTDMRIMRAEHNDRGWRLKYITLDDTYPIAAIERRLTRAAGEAVRMINLHYDFDTAARMIYA